jgi:hypothetical protein
LPRERRPDPKRSRPTARNRSDGLLGKAPPPEELRGALGIRDDEEDQDRAESEADGDGEDQEYAGVALFEE